MEKLAREKAMLTAAVASFVPDQSDDLSPMSRRQTPTLGTREPNDEFIVAATSDRAYATVTALRSEESMKAGASKSTAVK